MKKQSSSFKEAFFGPAKYDYSENSRTKRQVVDESSNETQLENEIRDEGDDMSGSFVQESQATLNESSSLDESDEDAAINCNWNIKVYSS